MTRAYIRKQAKEARGWAITKPDGQIDASAVSWARHELVPYRLDGERIIRVKITPIK